MPRFDGAGTVERGPWAASLWGTSRLRHASFVALSAADRLGRVQRGVESLPDPEVAVRGSHRLAPAGGPLDRVSSLTGLAFRVRRRLLVILALALLTIFLGAKLGGNDHSHEATPGHIQPL